jgi:hypothetical protein
LPRALQRRAGNRCSRRHKRRSVELPYEFSFNGNLHFLREYTKVRGTAYELCAAGARTHDAAVIDRCVAELQHANKLAEDWRAKRASNRTWAE